MAQKNLVSKEVKEQIMARIKEGVPIAKLAEEHGLKHHTIDQWVSRSVIAPPSVLELARLKRENQALKELLGELTMELKLSKKKADGQ